TTGRGAAAVVVAARQLRLQGEALHTRREPAAARAPPRLEGDLLSRRARRADRSHVELRPARRLSRALRHNRRARAADAAAGRRLRALPRRRSADEDRPRLDGMVARSARPIHGYGRCELRVLAACEAQGARLLEEAPPSPRG